MIVDISLTQKIDTNPIIYTGSGTIYQDKHGILQLKLYSKIDNIKKTLSNKFKYHTLGKIIENDNYYTMKAIDLSGKEWISDNIWISTHVSVDTNGIVIKSSLEEIELIEDGTTTEKNNFFIIVPGKFEIPCNKKEDLPNGGWHLNRSVFSINNIDFELKKKDNYLSITANSTPEYLKVNTYIIFLEALSIITGRIILPVIAKNTQQDHAILKIKSVSNTYSNKKFPEPFKHSTPSDLQSFSCFLGKYLMTFDAPYSDLFGYWHKVNRAWQVNITNSSLSLGVAIEGIIRTYFGELGMPDNEIEKQALEAKNKLKNIDIGRRIKERLLSSIGGLLKNTSPKGALYRLAKDGLISKKMASEWLKLRNNSVHPDKLNEDPRAIQKYIDQIYSCIALFYCLFFIIIKYDVSCIDYSEKGWPEKKLINIE